MRPELNSVFLGAISCASLVAALFFLRFWRQSGDRLFLWFAVAFSIDAVVRLFLGLGHIDDEQQPFVYICRLLSFCFIIFAIVQKNWPDAGKGSRK